MCVTASFTGSDKANQIVFEQYSADVFSESNLPSIPGGKKLIYTHVEMPLTAIEDFGKLGETDPRFARLDEICKANNGLWCKAAEDYVLANWKAE